MVFSIWMKTSETLGVSTFKTRSQEIEGSTLMGTAKADPVKESKNAMKAARIPPGIAKIMPVSGPLLGAVYL